MYYTLYDSPLGALTLAADDKNLCELWLDGRCDYRYGYSAAQRDDINTTLTKAKLWLDEYFDGKQPSLALLPLAPQGSSFQKMVLQFLCEIPYGATVTYGDLARRAAATLGKATMSAQAVGGAVGRNPISIIIPCHRVVGANGNLVGFGGGLDKKIWLLNHEGLNTAQFHMPKNK